MKLRIGLFCLLGGLCFTIPALGAGNFGYWLLSGLVTTASLVPVVRHGTRSLWAQFGIIFVLLEVIGLVCTLSEGVVFFPETKAQMLQVIPGGTVINLIVAGALMGLATALKLTDPAPQQIAHRLAGLVGPLVLASAASYVVYYLIFGAITFQFFTKQYYPHASDQVAAMGGWFWGYQLARGLLMTLAVVPVIYTLRLPRWQTALIAGMLVWVIGGASPLLVPNGMMGTTQRYIHIVEIMSQNVALGITAALLLRPRMAKAIASMHAMRTA
jgi:hypothetical protein